MFGVFVFGKALGEGLLVRERNIARQSLRGEAHESDQHNRQQQQTAAQPGEFFQRMLGVGVDAFRYFAVFVIQG